MNSFSSIFLRLLILTCSARCYVALFVVSDEQRLQHELVDAPEDDCELRIAGVDQVFSLLREVFGSLLQVLDVWRLGLIGFDCGLVQEHFVEDLVERREDEDGRCDDDLSETDEVPAQQRLLGASEVVFVLLAHSVERELHDECVRDGAADHARSADDDELFDGQPATLFLLEAPHEGCEEEDGSEASDEQNKEVCDGIGYHIVRPFEAVN